MSEPTQSAPVYAEVPRDPTQPVPGSREPVPGTRPEMDPTSGEPFHTGPDHTTPEETTSDYKEPKKWTHYAHLASGEVVKINKRIHDEIVGAGSAFRRDGMEHHVIGVYPRENEFKTEEKDEEE